MREFTVKIINRFKQDLWLYMQKYTLINSRFPFEKAKENIKRKNKMRILFFVETPAKWCSDSLFKELKKHDCFEVNLAVQLPDNPYFKNYVYDFFKKIDENLIALEPVDNRYPCILDSKPDLVFYEQPWHISAPNKIEEISKHCLTAYIPYGFMSIENDSAHYYMPFHFCLWRYFAENKAQKDLLRKRNKHLSSSVLNLGYPKLDVYHDIHPKKPERKLIIYAPHWSITGSKLVVHYSQWPVSGDDIHFSTFDKNYKYFLEKAKSTPQYDWVYKPHPGLQWQVTSTGLMSEEEYLNYENEWANLENASVVNNGNYFDLFKQSSVLITDSVSFLSEYLPTGNPIIWLKTKDHCRLNTIAKKVVKHYYKAYNTKQVDDLFERIVEKGDDYAYNKRMKSLKYVMDNERKACEKITDYLLETFELDREADND